MQSTTFASTESHGCTLPITQHDSATMQSNQPSGRCDVGTDRLSRALTEAEREAAIERATELETKFASQGKRIQSEYAGHLKAQLVAGRNTRSI